MFNFNLSVKIYRSIDSIYRAANARQSYESGTGFGLLQVQRIIKMLHGKVTYESEVGKGTTFSVILQKANDVSVVVKSINSIPVGGIKKIIY